MQSSGTYALIGAGPSGLAGARNLQKAGIDFTGFESADDVGGLWNIDNPLSTVYESAHLISSRTTTEFTEFGMRADVADYPSHRELMEYFGDFANEFGLYDHFRFATRVDWIEPEGELWRVKSTGPSGESSELFAGVVIANGTLAKPAVPEFAGEFAGDIMHTSSYKSPRIFAGKRVLVIGAGNSGCDIAVDAVHHGDSIDMSVRRGYYFVPKYLFGRPADTLNQGKPLPARIKQAIDSRVLKIFTGDPVRFGFPKPEYKIYESHPIVNTLILHHVGHGDVQIMADIDRFDGHTVHFTDGRSGEYDLIMLATGYHLDYPFVDRSHLNWTGMAPDLYLNIFTPTHDNLFVLGMIEASGIGWQGRYEQAELVAAYIGAKQRGEAAAYDVDVKIAGPRPDLSGGYHYLGLERMSYYVNKDAYRSAVGQHLAALLKGN